MTEYSERYFRSKDGLRLHYRYYAGTAQRTPVLCIPGLTRNSRDFDSVAAHIALRRPVLCSDLRGRGQSDYDSNWENYTVAVERDDVVQLLETENIRRVIVLGTSRGGIVAMALAATHHSRLAGVILNDIGAQLEASGLARIMEMLGRKFEYRDWHEAALALKEANQGSFLDVGDAGWMGFAKAIYRNSGDRIVPDYDLNLAKALRGKESSNRPAPAENVKLWPLFGALNGIPVLLLRGANSDLLSEETATKMGVFKPDMAIVTVDKRGHVPFLDEPEAVAAIDKFLQEIG